MDKRNRVTVGIVAAVAVVGIGAGVGVAGGADDDEPLRGNRFDRATAAALEHVGQGSVTETEAGDDGAAYEVEVRLDDGSQVEVQLDEDFKVIGTESDDDGPTDVEESGSDD